MNKWQFDKERLIALREMLGLSQEKFAERIGTVKQHLSLWETGETMPNVRSLIRICNEFNVPPKYFFTLIFHHTDEIISKPEEVSCTG